MARKDNPRLLAVEAVSRVLDTGAGLAEVDELKSEIAAESDPRNIAFARHLAYGVLRWLSALEWLAGELLDRPLKRRDRDIQRLILIGLFELWKGEKGQHAAVNETAECARLVGKPWAVGVINAVLRRFQREQDDCLDRLSEQAARFAHPTWLSDQIRADWPQNWQGILDANNRQAGLWLRVNRRKITVREFEEALVRSGHEALPHPFAPDAIEVRPPAPVEQLPGFHEGHFSVQDPAAQLAVQWLDPQANHRVLDACAAPGGKTCHILECAPFARVVALDRSAGRLGRLEENAGRLGLADPARLTMITADALQTESWWDGVPFDRILLDAPCSATGVIRRHPEIKWLRTADEVTEAITLQAGLLRSLWPLLRAGGMLVYATCSELRDENSEQISRFIESHGDALAEAPEVPYGVPCATGRQILPGEADMDGFFYARVRRMP